jgi:biotin carboxyl carrier protein
MALAAAGRLVVVPGSGVAGALPERSLTERVAVCARRSCIAAPALRECFLPAARARGVPARALAASYVEEESNVSQAEEEVVEEGEDEANPLMPSAFEVQNLLMQVCDETSNIAEVQLKVGSFSLKVRREIGKPAPPPKPVAAGPPVLGKAMVESIPATSVPAASKPTKPKLALSAPSLKPISNFSSMEAAADAGLVFVTSPKVGLFRKGRTVKGKSGPSLCAEGQVIKKGQVVCYLEQLGTQQPIEADVTGEVEKVLWEDGEPVGYGDPLIAIRPSFPGIKVKGQLQG